MTFWETLAISSIPAIISGSLVYFRNRIDVLRYKADSMAERSAKHFFNHKGYTDRKFDTIKSYLGGWDEDEHELRRILVRAGAIRTFRKEKGEEVEYWTLLSRIPEKINKLKSRSKKTV